MNSKDNVRNRIIRAQGSENSAVLFVVGDNEMKDSTIGRNIIGRACTMILTLLMAVTMVATSAFQAGNFAFADTEYVTGSSNARFIAEGSPTDGGKAWVATYKQLKDALTMGYSQIIISPNAATALTDNAPLEGSKGPVTYNGTFYIPIEEPLVVSHNTTISSVAGTEVRFARSGNGGNGAHDSKAFSGANKITPALFNVDAGKTLTINGNITMTGEEVTSTFDEGQAETAGETPTATLSADTGNLHLGANSSGSVFDLRLYSAETNKQFWVDEDGRLACEHNGNTHYVKGNGPAYGLFSSTSDEDVRVRNTNGTAATSLKPGQKYVLFDPRYNESNGYLQADDQSGNGALYHGSLGDALVFKAGGEAGDGTGSYNYGDAARPSSWTLYDMYFTDVPVGSGNYLNRTIMIGDGNGNFLSTPKNPTPDSKTGIVDVEWMSEDEVFPDKDDESKIHWGAIWTIGSVKSTYTNAGDGYNGTYFFKNKDDFILGINVLTKTLEAYKSNHVRVYNNNNPCGWDNDPKDGWQHNSNRQIAFENRDIKYLKLQSTAGHCVNAGGYSSSASGDPLVIYRYDLAAGSFEESSGGGSSGSVSSSQEYVAPSITFNVKSKDGTGEDNAVWSYGAGNGVIDGGYFIHTNKGSVVLNSDVTLTGLHTAADVKNAAPVFVGGKGATLTLDGAEITNNTVGYSGGNESKSSLMIKDYNNEDIEEFVEGTDMTNSVGGIILTGEATATFTSGHVNGNRGDVGAILVKEGAELVMSGTEEGTTINSNVGFHHAGAVQVESGGVVKMNGGTMSNNVAWYKGGAVWATEWGTNGYADLDWSTKPFPTLKNEKQRKEGGYFSMDGGTLKNNTAFKRAGAIEVESNNVYLKSGEISGNVTRSLGGAIYVEGDNTTYTYTLVVENGYIGNNKAVKPATPGDDNNKINRYLDGSGKLTEASSSNPSSHDHDFSYWGAAGNGGGVWLCPRGGTASFTGQNVIIDNNTKERNGTDLFLQPGYGSVMLQQMKGVWKNENTNQPISQDGVYNGPLPLQNYGENGTQNYSEPATGLIIKDNLARDGGGIAANGTVIFGSPSDVFRYDARVNVYKTWDNVPVAERENITIQVGYGDPDNENDFTILDTTLIKESTNQDALDIEITLDGTNSQNGNYSDAILAETSTGRDENVWKGYATIPSAVNGVALYKFEAPEISKLNKVPANSFTQSEITAYQAKNELDPSKASDLKYLYYIAKYHPELLKVKAGTSKVKIRETNTKYDKTYNLDLYVDGINITENPTVLIEPASGTEHGRFNTNFTSIAVGVGVTNEIAKREVTLTKVSADNNNKPVKGTEFIVVEILRDHEGKSNVSPDFRVADPAGAWNPGAVRKNILDVAQKNENGSLAVYKSSKEGEFTVKDLRPGRRYFLFEYEPSPGYEAISSPWIIEVAENGKVSVLGIDPEAKMNNVSALNKVKRNRDGDILQDFAVKDGTKNSIYRTYWPVTWFYNSNDGGKTIGTAKNPITSKKLVNSTAQIKINKVSSGNGTTFSEGAAVSGAKFAFADVGWTDETKTNIFTAPGGIIKNGTSPVIVDCETDGTINLTSVIKALKSDSNDGEGQGRTLYDDKISLLMFEVKAANAHKMKTVPWLVIIDTDGSVEIREHESPYLFNKSPLSVTGAWQYAENRMSAPIGQFTTVSTSTATANAKVTNEPAEFKVYKVDSDSTENNIIPVVGAEFKLYKAEATNHKANGEPYGKFVITDKTPIAVNGNSTIRSESPDGKITLPITAPGEYILYETSAPRGYKTATAPWGIWIKEDNSVVAYRVKTQHLDEVEGWIADSENSALDIELSCEHLEFNGDYLKNDKEYIELIKVKGNSALDISTSDRIKGAKFKLYGTTERTENGKSVWYKGTEITGRDEYLTSDENGVIRLPWSVVTSADTEYWLEETHASPGYEKNEAPWIIWIKNGKIDVIRYADPSKFNGEKVVIREWDNLDQNKTYIHNKPLKFKKISAQNSERVLSNVEFDVYKVSKYGYRPEKNYTGTDKTAVNNELFGKSSWNYSNGTVKLLTHTDSDKIDGTVTSSSDGTFSIPVTESGLYMIYEKEAPEGYVDRESPWILLIMDDGRYQLMQNKNEGTVADFGKANDGKSWWIDHYEKVDGLVLKNERKPIELTKVDEEGNAITVQQNSTEQKAKFVITDAELGNMWYVPGTRPSDDGYASATIVSKARKNTSGEVIYYEADNNGKITIADLPAGNYFLFETQAPTGFVRATTPWLIQVTDNEIGRSWNIFSIKEDYRDMAKGLDSKDKTLSPDDLKIAATWWPDSWFEDESVQNLENRPKYITKVDADNTNALLEGAKFTLYEAYTETLDNYNRPTSDMWIRMVRGDGITLESDSMGRIELPSSITRKATVPYKDPKHTGQREGYLLVETKAPNGYKTSATPWWITVDSNGNVTVKYTTHAIRDDLEGYDWWYTSDFTNSNGLVKNTPNETYLTKVDKYTNEKLPGAEFMLYKAKKSNDYHPQYSKAETDGKPTSRSDSNGKITLPTLEPGDYILEETKAPEGYEKSKTPWVVTITRYTNYYGYTYKVESWPLYEVDGKPGYWVTNSTICDGMTTVENIPSVNLKKVDVATVAISEGDDGEEIISAGDTTKFLEGVKFKLYESNENIWTKKSETAVHVSDTNPEGTVVTDKNGVLELGSLTAGGRYLLYEVEAKEGYILPSAPWRIKIGSDGKIENLWVPADENGTEYKDTDHKTYLTNTEIYNLPSAGGMGTYWFMIIGAMMMGFALTAGFTKVNLLKLLRR